MYPAFPPVDVHITYVLYIYLLCMISLVLLYKKSPSMQPPLRRYFYPFFTIVFLHFRFKDVFSHRGHPVRLVGLCHIFQFLPVHGRGGEPYLMIKWFDLHVLLLSPFPLSLAYLFSTTSSPTRVSTILPIISISSQAVRLCRSIFLMHPSRPISGPLVIRIRSCSMTPMEVATI